MQHWPIAFRPIGLIRPVEKSAIVSVNRVSDSKGRIQLSDLSFNLHIALIRIAYWHALKTTLLISDENPHRRKPGIAVLSSTIEPYCDRSRGFFAEQVLLQYRSYIAPNQAQPTRFEQGSRL